MCINSHEKNKIRICAFNIKTMPQIDVFLKLNSFLKPKKAGKVKPFMPSNFSKTYKIKLSYFFLFFFSELGTEPRALSFLGKCSATELNPQPQTIIFLSKFYCNAMIISPCYFINYNFFFYFCECSVFIIYCYL